CNSVEKYILNRVAKPVTGSQSRASIRVILPDPGPISEKLAGSKFSQSMGRSNTNTVLAIGHTATVSRLNKGELGSSTVTDHLALQPMATMLSSLTKCMVIHPLLATTTGEIGRAHV